MTNLFDITFAPPQPGQVIPLYIPDSSPHAYGIIARLADVIRAGSQAPDVRAWAEKILLDSKAHSLAEQVNAVMSWVREKLIYAHDPVDTEWTMTATEALRRIQANGQVYGDCDDFTVLVGSLLGALGFTVRPAGVQRDGSPLFNHVLIQIYFEDSWHDLDACQQSFSVARSTEYFTHLLASR